MRKERELTDRNTDTQGRKSDYPLIHCFKEVNLIKMVVMKTLRARKIIKPYANGPFSD